MTHATGTKIFVNIPVNDLSRSKRRFADLGFSFDENLANENMEVVKLSEDGHVLLAGRAVLQDLHCLSGSTRSPRRRVLRARRLGPATDHEATGSSNAQSRLRRRRVGSGQNGDGVTSGTRVEVRRATPADAAVVGRLLFDFNTEFETSTPSAEEFAITAASLTTIPTRGRSSLPRLTSRPATPPSPG